jgi:hypothetical protein
MKRKEEDRRQEYLILARDLCYADTTDFFEDVDEVGRMLDSYMRMIETR